MVFNHYYFFSVKSAEHLVRLKLVLGLCLLLVSSLDFIINTLFVFIFPDWRLWPTDMGEISGAERNKGLFPPHFHVLVWFFAFCHFHFPVFLLLVSAYSSFMSCGSFCIIASVFICRHFSYVFFSLFPFCPPGCVSSAHLSSLHLHPPPIIFFSSSLQFISLVSTQQGGCSSCFPTVHVCSSYAVDKIDSYWLLVCYHVVFRVTAAFLWPVSVVCFSHHRPNNVHPQHLVHSSNVHMWPQLP